MIDEQNKISDEKKDLVRNTLIAATSAFPIVGGILSFFLDKYLPSAVEARKNLFLLKVEKDLEHIPMHTIKSICHDPEYTSIVLKVFKNALEDFRNEKVNAFRNILINATVDKSISFDEQSFFVKPTTDLTVDQIRILHLFYLRDMKKSISFGAGNNINTYIKNNWHGVDESYRFALVTEIMRYGLVSQSRNSQKVKGEGHQLSDFGHRFVSYIFTPIDIDEDDFAHEP